MKPYYHKMLTALKINEKMIAWRIFRVAVTFLLVDFTWIFFRAASVGEAFGFLKKFCLEFRLQWYFSEGFPDMFGSTLNFMIIMASLLVVFVIDLLQYKGIDFRTVIFRQQIVFRWIIYWMIFLVIINWGAYGTGYEQKQFIYFQF